MQVVDEEKNATGGIADGDHVYFGTASESTNFFDACWRVLDADKANTGDAGMFLLSEKLLGEPSSSYGNVYFNNPYTKGNAWQGSDAQDWCSTFLSNSFSETEKAAMIATNKSDDAYHYEDAQYSYTVDFGASDNILKGDKVFFLSAEEADFDDYGFTDNASRKANFDSMAGYWWLRSPYANNYNDAGLVYDGSIDYINVGNDDAARPAFNLNLSSVLFTSAAEGGKSSGAAGADSLTLISDYSGKDWKLTLFDSTRSGFTAAYDSRSGDVITVRYSGAKAGGNEYISAIIVNSSGEITYYGNLVLAQTGNDKTVTVDLAGKYNDGDTLYVFNEQVNGNKKTDYSSELKKITILAQSTTAVTAENITVGNDETIKVTIPSDATGTVTVTVTGPDGKSTSYSVEITAEMQGKGQLTLSDLAPGSYSVKAEYPGDSSYASSSGETTFVVKKFSATITAKDQTLTYTGAIQGEGDTVYNDPDKISGIIDIKDLQDGDSLSQIEYFSQTDKPDAGDYEITVKSAVIKRGDTVVTDNYEISYVSGTLTIKPVEATITVDNASKEEGETDPDFTGTVEGLLKEDDLGEVSYNRRGDEEDPGFYQGVLTAAYTENPNYSVTVKNGDFTIRAAARTYTVSFEKNGGSGTMDDVKDVSGDYELPKCLFKAPEGQTFNCWLVDGSEYAESDTITVTGDTTVTAQWKDIPAHKHSLTLVEEEEATCTEPGNTAYYTCSGCDLWFEDATGLIEITDKSSVITKALGHRWDNGTVTKKPTETEDGEKTYTCRNDSSHTKTETIPATGHEHSLTKVEAVAATCTEVGNSTYYVCDGCDRWFEDAAGRKQITDKNSVMIDPVGHDWGKWIQTKAPTATAEGEETRTCSRCREKETRSVPRLDVESFTVTFNANGHGSAPADQIVESGKTASEPAALTAGGYSFGGWFKEAACENKFSFDTAITKDTTLYAKWTRRSSGGGSSGQDRTTAAAGSWNLDSSGWHYRENGSLVAGAWRYLSYNGINYWYYFDETGLMQTGWLDWKGNRYYLYPVSDGWMGRMLTGWQQIDGKWYFFETAAGSNQGRMYRSERTPDGYYVGADGTWDGNPAGAGL